MAITKAVNYKNSGRAAMEGAIDYCCNPRKIRHVPPATLGISSNPKKAFRLNKWLHHQHIRKRWYKTFIVSMESLWPRTSKACAEYERKMGQLMRAAMNWWGRKGHQTTGAVHSNTSHPHFHVELDTCNVLTGKQFSQHPKELYVFKAYLSEVMTELGLGEIVRQHDFAITETEMYEEDDRDDVYSWLFREDEQDEKCIESDGGEFCYGPSPRAAYDIGAPIWDAYQPMPPREICKIIDSTTKRVMCRIVDNSAGRKMCSAVSGQGVRKADD